MMKYIGRLISGAMGAFNKSPFWFVLSSVISISIGITFFAPISEMYKGLASLPSIGGLLTALFQVARDDAAHKRSIDFQNKQQLFNLGATSHMANTVFDKHVEFSEKYLSEVHKLVASLTSEGPTKSALAHANNLNNLRIDYTAWITPEIEDKLLPFENAVRTIGAKASYVEAIRGQEDSSESRSKAIGEMFDTFSTIMGLESRESKDAETTIKEVMNRVREILNIVELVSIRDFLIDLAASAAKK